MRLVNEKGCLQTYEPTAELPASLAPLNPAAVYLARLALRSRPVQRQALDVIARLLTSGRERVDSLAWHGLRYAHTQAIRAELAGRYAPATANRMLAALKGTLKECWRLGLVSAEEYHRAADIAAVRGETLPAGRALSPGELKALFAACAEDSSAVGRRDAALLAVLYSAGLRRSEAASLLIADYEGDTGQVTVRSGKGRKDRITYARGGALAAVRAWLAVRGEAPGALFHALHWSGKSLARGMTAQAIYAALRRRAKQAKVPRFSPHDCRRSWIGDLLDGGADLVTVQKLAGHASVVTTAKYDRRGEAAKRKAADLLHIPFAE